jgi:hypothetical protein
MSHNRDFLELARAYHTTPGRVLKILTGKEK